MYTEKRVIKEELKRNVKEGSRYMYFQENSNAMVHLMLEFWGVNAVLFLYPEMGLDEKEKEEERKGVDGRVRKVSRKLESSSIN